MTQPTLNLSLLPVQDPVSVIVMNDREASCEARDLMCGPEKYIWSASIFSLTLHYRTLTARVRPLLTNKALAQVKGLFDNGLKGVDYATLKPASLEEAAAMGNWIAAERIKAIVIEVAEDYEESITGPADFDPNDAGEIQSIRADLVLRVVDALDAIDRFLAKHLRRTYPQVRRNSTLMMTAATMGVMLMSEELDQQVVLNSTMKPAISDASVAAHRGWVRELVNHLTDPEITEARSVPPVAVSLPIQSAARAVMGTTDNDPPFAGALKS